MPRRFDSARTFHKMIQDLKLDIMEIDTEIQSLKDKKKQARKNINKIQKDLDSL